MRAVSIHVADSSGVISLLHSGHKVDVQIVTGRGAKASETLVRTALENLTVLSVQTQAEVNSQGLNTPVVTLLAKPLEADILAAGDAGANLRLVLRNPGDQTRTSHGAISVGTAMRAVQE
jgi:Flp pilus assembly protein CpaB